MCANFSHAYTEGALGVPGVFLHYWKKLILSGLPTVPRVFSSWVVGNGVTDLPLGRSAFPGDFPGAMARLRRVA